MVEPTRLRAPEFRRPLGRLSVGGGLRGAGDDRSPRDRAGSGALAGVAKAWEEDAPCGGVDGATALAAAVAAAAAPTPARALGASGLRVPSRTTLAGEQLRPSRCDSSGALSRGDHIRVAVRVRPLPADVEGIIEVAGASAIAIRKDAATGGNEFLKSQQGRIEERVFDRVFGPDSTQRDVYTWSCKPLVRAAIVQSRSATVFVYGATGAGKTHTMFGGPENSSQRGLIFRAIPEVFHELEARTAAEAEGFRAASISGGSDAEVAELGGRFEVKVSFLEIYNENVRDLLQDGGGGGQCKVLEDERKGVVKVANLVEAIVRKPEEALFYLRCGMHARTVEATAANSQSSRAHAVFSMTIEHVKEEAAGLGPFARRTREVRRLISKISLIDLAGSERASITQNSGSALKDGARINQSLLALANCIDALCTKTNIATPRKKAPYRDSKLTLMLKSSLTGEGLVAMIANVHPGRTHFEDSNNTLEYARRASTVRAPPLRRLSRCPPTEGATCAGGITSRSRGGESFGLGGSDEEPEAEAHEEDSITGTSSASSLPRPRISYEELRRRRKTEAEDRTALSAVGGGGGGATTTEATTTSSSREEECLSEISLNTPTGNRRADGRSEHLICNGSAEWVDGQGAHVEVAAGDDGEKDIDGGGAAQELASPARAEDLYEDDFEASSPTAAKGEALAAEEPLATFSQQLSWGDVVSGAEVDALTLANALISRLKAEKLQLSDRLRGVTQERNSLLQERKDLEDENERLREEGSFKDERLATLLRQSAKR